MTIHALAAEVFRGFRAVQLHVRIMASDAVKTAAVRLPTATHLYLLDLAQCLRSEQVSTDAEDASPENLEAHHFRWVNFN